MAPEAPQLTLRSGGPGGGTAGVKYGTSSPSSPRKLAPPELCDWEGLAGTACHRQVLRENTEDRQMPEAEAREPGGPNDSEFGEHRGNWRKKKKKRNKDRRSNGCRRRGASARAGVCAGQTAGQRAVKEEGGFGTSAPTTILLDFSLQT